jgi:hypothetical protein
MRKNHIHYHILTLISFFFVSTFFTYSQVTLDANGVTNTYDLINSVLAPGATAEETPDQFHTAFGQHIIQVQDTSLNQWVFEFYLHISVPAELQDEVTGDTDRQRCEIKTYAPSPANLKGVPGQTMINQWKFRLPIGFQPSSSFTHIHQIKAVGGDDSNPLFTLTPRYKSSGNQLQLIYIDNNDVTTYLTSVNLAPFIGNWVEATETIVVDSLHGSYSISIKKVSDATTLLSCSVNNICTIRTSNTFIRPKWGIYRSILDITRLRDETIRFANFSILVEPTIYAAISNPIQDQNEFTITPNPATNAITLKYALPESTSANIILYDLNGQIIKTLMNNEYLQNGIYQKTCDIANLPKGLYLVRFTTNYSTKVTKLIVN